MGLLGVALSVITGEIYQRLALQNQQHSLEELVSIKINEILNTVVKETSEFGLTVQSNPSFKKSFKNNNPSSLQHYLNEQFRRYFFTQTVLKLEKIIALDSKFNVVSASSEGSQLLGPTSVPCPELLDQAKLRTGTDRLKTLSQLCDTRDKPVITVLVPTGGLKVMGYLLIAVDPVLNITTAEKYLNMPLTIYSPQGQTIFRSKHMRSQILSDNMLTASHMIRGSNGNTIYRLLFASDITALNKKLIQTRWIIIGAAAFITAITALLSILLLQKKTLKPLNMLTQQLRLVRKDKAHLGDRVKVTGNVEVKEMAEVFNDMTGELDVLYKTLESMAFTDSLTGLPNRALFYQRADEAVKISQANNEPFYLLMLDLDRFKYINDTLGHHIGDQFLQEVGSRLQQSIRTTDTIARLGGDEFAAIIKNEKNINSGSIVAEKIIKSLNRPINIGQYNLSANCSIGIVHYPNDGDNINLLMQRADVAMYHAKKNRQDYVFYEQDLDRNSIIQLNLEAELYDAMSRGELQLHYQPKIDLQKGCTVAVEALLRWNHPTRGYILPEEFIPLAEHSGLIHLLTKWVAENALTQCALWHKKHLNIGIAINLSARSLEDANILDTIRDALITSGVKPHYLSLEITESTVMADPLHAMHVLGKLDAMGVNISIDDFGTGYSSLAYLKKLPVNEIKIDKSFVIEMNEDPNDEVIVRSTIELGRNMGLAVTAEGVENEEALNKLVDMGCTMVQGYYLCVPCTAPEVTQWLKNSPWGWHSTIPYVV